MANALLGACISCYLVLFISCICSFAFDCFARVNVFLFNATARKKMCCNAKLFPGNLDLLSETLGGPDVPLVCGFIRRDNVRAWRELFTNLYKLKSCI